MKMIFADVSPVMRRNNLVRRRRRLCWGHQLRLALSGQFNVKQLNLCIFTQTNRAFCMRSLNIPLSPGRVLHFTGFTN